MTITNRVRVDIIRPYKQPEVYVKQGDIDSRVIVYELYNGQSPWTIPEGTLAEFHAKKPDNTFADISATVSGNNVTVTLDEQVTAVGGAVFAEVTLTNGDDVVSTFTHVIKVQPRAVPDDAIESEVEITAYREIVSQMSDILDDAENARDAAQGYAGDAEDSKEEAQDLLDQMMVIKGSPLTAATAADMTDTDRVYVYVGSEAGYIAGDWYYYDGDSWEVGGVYNSTAVQTDPTLSAEGEAADAKATGDKITELKSDLQVFENDTIDKIGTRILIENSSFTTGKYYKNANVGQDVTLEDNAGSIYIAAINVSEYMGQKVRIRKNNAGSTSGRCTGFVNASNKWVTIIPESSMNPTLENGYYVYETVVTADYFVASFTSANTYVTIEFFKPFVSADDITRIEGEIDDLGDEVESVGELVKVKIQPPIIPGLPINVYRKVGGFECDLPYTDLTGYADVYVDSVNGDDTDDGTEGNPVKTLNRAIYLAQKQMFDNNKKVVINVAEGSTFFYDDYPINQAFTKSCIIRAEKNATIFCGVKPTFTESGGYYVSEALTSYTPIGCVDTSATDDYGIYKTMNVVSSASDVAGTENSYYIDTINKVVYVNPETSINDIVVIFSDKFAINPGVYSFIESSFVMFENFRFVGNSTATARSSSTVGETIIRTIYMKGCIFEHGFTNNCVSFNDFEYTYLIDCVAGFSKYDCYNYHFTRKPTPTNAVVVEVNCIAKESGYYNNADASDNLTTCHDGANIARFGCRGYNGNGSMCADVNGCYSVCVDCTYINTAYNKPSGANRSAFVFNNDISQRNGKTLMQNCYGYDSRNNRMVSAIDLTLNGINAGGTIEATTINVGKDLI